MPLSRTFFDDSAYVFRKLVEPVFEKIWAENEWIMEIILENERLRQENAELQNKKSPDAGAKQ